MSNVFTRGQHMSQNGDRNGVRLLGPKKSHTRCPPYISSEEGHILHPSSARAFPAPGRHTSWRLMLLAIRPAGSTPKNLVKRSAGFAVPATFLTDTRLSATAFCSHRHRVCMCRAFPNPRRHAKLFAELESVCRIIGPLVPCMPISWHMACMPMVRTTPSTMA